MEGWRKNLTIEKLKYKEFKKFKELIMYFIFGVSTTIVNILVYHMFLLCKIDYKIANLFAVVLGKLYAYVTNKKFVFCTKCETPKDAIKEFMRFVYARGITGLVDYFGLIVAVEYFGADIVITKYVLQIIIILLNYILSKLMVFKKGIYTTKE